MAEYVKFRITAAKAGVTMALLALIGGIAARGGSGPPTLNSTPAASNFLKLGGITGNTKNAFVKIEKKFLKLDSSLVSLEKKLAKSYYSAAKVNSTFLKIKSANDNFLKITSANTTFLKIDDANNTFLKVVDASAKFLKVGGIAANSSELGGLTPDAFVQGKGGIVSGAAQNVGASPVSLLHTPDNKLAVAVSASADSLTLTFTNNTGANLDYVAGLPAVQRGSIVAGQNPGITFNGMPDEFTLQIFPNAGSQRVLTLTISGEPGPVGAAPQTFNVVGQLLIGLL